ncbi:MAG: hypothetical protein Q9210_001440 [Variospora velana]
MPLGDKTHDLFHHTSHNKPDTEYSYKLPGYTPPYPPRRVFGWPHATCSANHKTTYDLQGIPQPTHPLWSCFWRDLSARPQDLGAEFINKLERWPPKHQKPADRIAEDEAYPKLLEICHEVKVYNDWEAERIARRQCEDYGRMMKERRDEDDRWTAKTPAERKREDDEEEEDQRMGRRCGGSVPDGGYWDPQHPMGCFA